jgi:hypothetical protein
MNLYVLKYGSTVLGVTAEHYVQATTMARNALAAHFRISPSLVGVLTEEQSVECRNLLNECVRLEGIEYDPVQPEIVQAAAGELHWTTAERLRRLTHPEAIPYLWLNYICQVGSDHPVQVVFASIY